MHQYSFSRVVSIVSSGALVGTLAVVALVACGSDNSGSGSSDDSDSGNGGPGQVFAEGGFGGGEASAVDGGNVFANDPLPTYCVLDAGMTPPPVTGTEACPSDKNLPGCGCTTAGQTAACWTGLRKNRDLGQCMDGMTTCEKSGEIGLAWGPCTGEVLPDPSATKGKAACQCFSAGQWKIADLSPCFVMSGGSDYAVSSYLSGTTVMCPKAVAPPEPKPTQDWSTDTLNVDCAGHFKLCYEIKAGSATAPTASDCSVAKVCTEADYPVANTDTAFPSLPSWTGSDSACATKFVNSGGYGEMSVVGEDILCDAIDDGKGNAFVFNRVTYCPLSCNTNPNGAGCMNCQQGGSGSF